MTRNRPFARPHRNFRREKKYSIVEDRWRYFSFDWKDYRASIDLLNVGTNVRYIISSNTLKSSPHQDYVMIISDSKILQFEKAEFIIRFNNHSIVVDFIDLRWLFNRKIKSRSLTGTGLILSFEYNIVDSYLRYAARRLYYEFSKILIQEITLFLGKSVMFLEIAFHYDITFDEWHEEFRRAKDCCEAQRSDYRDFNNRMYGRV